MCISLNIALYNINDYESSIVYIKKAIFLYEYLDNNIAAANCYFNYINALRYSLKFSVAIKIVDDCLVKFIEYVDLYHKFILQKMILYFNLNDYDNIIQINRIINPKKLDTKNKSQYNFILGHIEHVYNKNPQKAYEYLTKAVGYYRKNNYAKDLCMLLHDLYEITGEERYKDESYEYENATYIRKNVLI